MTYKTVKEFCDAGAVLVSCTRSSGRWDTWIYELPEGTFWRVHQPSDYSPYVRVSKVEKVVTEVVSFIDEQT